MKFYDDLLNNYIAHKNLRDDYVANAMIDYLTVEGMQRILFDSEQAIQFTNINNGPDSDIQSLIKLPYNNFYLEFTEPIELGLSRLETDEDEINNRCRSFILLSNHGIKLTQYQGNTLNNIYQIIMFFTTPNWDRINQKGFLDSRSFLLDINTGFPATRVESIKNDSPEDAYLFENYNPKDYVMLDNEINWQGNWAKNMKTYSSLIHWILIYMMAKGIYIEEEHLSRQQRREMERKNIPHLWHVLKVEPKFTEEYEQSNNNSVRTHEIRYDVTGYLRFGNHKLKDGTSKRSIEWVRPHQRGLKNKLYVPKISKVISNKQIDPRMDEYFGNKD